LGIDPVKLMACLAQQVQEISFIEDKNNFFELMIAHIRFQNTTVIEIKSASSQGIEFNG
jgi:hypothetical protein